MSLGNIVKIAADLRAEMREAGANQAELEAATERIVRANWPFVREWKYLCDRCRDYGLELFDCPGDATCGRTRPHGPHDYGHACWCAAGAKFRPKPRPDGDDSVGQAGKTPKKMTRFGR